MDIGVITLFFTLFVLTGCIPSQYESQDLTHSRIVNGYEVNISEVPYQATLRQKASGGWSHLCGASIITSKALLTAAHCVSVYQTNVAALKVSVGTSHRISTGKSFDVKRIIIHEDYSSKTLENDIALIVIHSKMSYSKSINAVSIAPKNYNLPNGTEAIVSGFGTVSYKGAGSPTLLAARVKIVDQNCCIRAYQGIASISAGMICASGNNPPRDACQGDSGGPLVANNVLVGIVSWGEKCADEKYPGVYTRVSEYETWVVSRVNQYT